METIKIENSQEISLIEWGIAAQSFDGRSESGDQYLVESFPNGVLTVVVDGLGHGPSAATAGKTAVTAMQGHAREPVDLLLRRCHESLRRTRGVVMSLASFNSAQGTVTWLGVGNVKGLLLFAPGKTDRPRERLLLRGGVVGYQLPTLRPSILPVKRGDLLVFATDGLRSAFTDGLIFDEPAQQMADRILVEYRRGTDDAMVLIARYVGLGGDGM